MYGNAPPPPSWGMGSRLADTTDFGTKTIANYKRTNMIGEGTYG